MNIGKAGISFGSVSSDKINNAYNQKIAELEAEKGGELTDKEKALACLKLENEFKEFANDIVKEREENVETAEKYIKKIMWAQHLIGDEGLMHFIRSLWPDHDKNKSLNSAENMYNILSNAFNTIV